MNICIFILCFDDFTLNQAKIMFGFKKWAKIICIPTNKYLENFMYEKWFLENKDLWINYDYVGTLSWKAYKKINIDKIDFIENKIKNEPRPDVIPFYYLNYKLVDSANEAHPKFKKIWVNWLNKLGFNEKVSTDDSIPSFYCNYWMAKPEWLLKYIEFFNCAKTILENEKTLQDDVNSNSMYLVGNISTTKCMEIFGNPYYTYHCFLFERLPCFFFWINNAIISG